MLTKFSCFLLLFTFIFLLISYLFELFLELWLSQQSNSTSKTATSASPFDFGVDQLKLILGFRGIYYLQQQHQQLSEKSLNVQQRKEKLAELVATSGQINHEELLQLRMESSTTSKADESRPSPTAAAAAGRSGSLKVFASAKLMEEEIDDSHIWLLYISPNEEPNEQEVVVLPNVWSTLVRQFGKFDLRFARFDCKADPLYCHRRGWHRSPRLVLVFPRSRNEVGRRIYHYPLDPQTHSTDVILWLQAQLSSQLSSIDDIDAMLERGARQVTEDDNTSHSKHRDSGGLVNVVAIMGEQFRHSPPLSLSLLALRFRDRVAFGVHFAKSADSLARLHAQLDTRLAPHLPIYLVVMHSDGGGGQLVVVYNADQPGPLSYAAMDAYLRGLAPENNDLCLVLFALANLYLGLNFFWTRCVTARRHLALCAITAVEVNLLLLLLSMTAVFWPLVGGSSLTANYLLSFVPEKWPLLVEQSLSLAHGSLWSSAFAFHFRAQLLAPYSTERFFVAFILSGAVLVTLRRCTPLVQQRLFGLSSSSSSSYDDELIIKGVFYWASVIGCFVGFLLFRKHSRRTTARRRHHHHHHHLPSGDFHDRTEQLRALGAAQLNNGDGRPLAANTEEWPNSEDEDDELEFEEEHIDLDSDLDRLLLESMFSGMAGNLWLQPELISTDYIHQLPVWSQVVAEDQEEEDEQHSPTAVEESASSSSSFSPSSTDVSDTEESSVRRDSLTVPLPKHRFAAISSSSKAVLTRPPLQLQHTSSIDAEQMTSCCTKKSPLNTKEAPQSSCCEKLADCGSSSGSSKESQKTGQQISSQLRAKLEERKLRKIIRIRRKRGKRSSAAVVSAASTTPAISTEVQQQHQEKPADFGQLSRPEWMLDFNDCTICLEAYRGAQAIIGLACGHNYHRDCLTQWLVRGNHCCPICRWPSYRLKHPRQQQAASWRRCC